MNFGHMYANRTSPAIVDCNFTVAATDSAGKGITGLKSNGYVDSVFMHTTATPATGNPNPASGYILVQLADNYVKHITSTVLLTSPVTGSNITISAGLTAGVAYQITALGTSTAADWLAIGLPAGLTAAVGMSFIAIATGAGSGSGTVKAVGTSGIDHIEIVGNSNLELGPQGVTNQGGWILMKCLLNTTLTAPTDATTIRLTFYMDNSSVTVDGD